MRFAATPINIYKSKCAVENNLSDLAFNGEEKECNNINSSLVFWKKGKYKDGYFHFSKSTEST